MRSTITAPALVFLVFCLPVLIGCKNSKSDVSSSDPGKPALKGITWILVKLNGSAPMKGKTATIRFRDNKASGSGSCNSYSGKYDLSGKKIKLKRIIITSMACSPRSVLKQEDRFMKALGTVDEYLISNRQLILRNKKGVELVFRPRAKDKNRALINTEWKLETIITGGLASSTVRNSSISALFDGKKVSGSAGCNNYSSSYTIDGESLKLSKMSFTEKRCSGEALRKQEGVVLSIIKNVTKYRITGSRLSLETGDGRRLDFHAR